MMVLMFVLVPAMTGMSPNVKIKTFTDARHYDKQNERRPEAQQLSKSAPASASSTRAPSPSAKQQPQSANPSAKQQSQPAKPQQAVKTAAKWRESERGRIFPCVTLGKNGELVSSVLQPANSWNVLSFYFLAERMINLTYWCFFSSFLFIKIAFENGYCSNSKRGKHMLGSRTQFFSEKF